MRIVSWNIENAARHLAALPAIVGQPGSLDVLCLQELRVRASDDDVVRALEAALPGYRCHHALPRDSRNVTFRGGRMYGVATFVRGRWRAEVPEWDREGRIVVVRRTRLAVVNVYAVNGTAKPYCDEVGRIGGDRNQFKRRMARASRERAPIHVVQSTSSRVGCRAGRLYPRFEGHGSARYESADSGPHALERSRAGRDRGRRSGVMWLCSSR